MAVTFPSSPTNGQQLTISGKTYTYSSAFGVWNITGGDNPIDILFTRSEFISTANQTTFSVTYNIDYPIEVFVNGLQYLASDYTATNGTSVVFDIGLPADAEVVIMYATSSLNTIPGALTDLSITDGTDGQVLTTDGAGNFTFEDASGGGGDAASSYTYSTLFGG